jgi:protein-L-isoaspartate(D-aspartate) O-methyltransferase
MPPLARRAFLGCAATIVPAIAWARVTEPYSPGMAPPSADAAAFVQWMERNRGERREYLELRYARFVDMIANHDLWQKSDQSAFLLTPREEFCFTSDPSRVYHTGYLAIGYGATITGPRVVGRMTSALEVSPDDKVLEVGTGSGYQSAYLSYLSRKVWTIEIIKPLAERTRRLYDALIAKGYAEYGNIATRYADGYYGWEEYAPFDKIIVTCGIDHIPPPLLQQLRAGGTMVIPIGPPGGQRLLRIDKQRLPDGKLAVRRSDLYDSPVPFVAFKKLQADAIQGTHDAEPGKLP